MSVPVTATAERLRLLDIAWREGSRPDGWPPLRLHIPWWKAVIAAEWARELDRECWLADVRQRLGLVTNEHGVPLRPSPEMAARAERERQERQAENDRRVSEWARFFGWGAVVQTPTPLTVVTGL